MSQRKAKEYRRAMEQYTGVAEDVDDLKRRVGALEARHYREDRDKAVDMIQRRAAAKKWEETVKARAMKKAGIERAGLEAADRVVAVSHYTKRLVMRQYGIPGDKIEVVHNAVSRSEADRVYAVPERCAHEKRVLFMGRVTFQKGPDYFVEAAKLVLDRIPDVRFVMAGSGDMLPNMVRRVAQLRIGSHFHFTGFLKDEEVDHMYAVSDLYVMPSVSEPFGIAPLEAMAYDVPVLISRQSGVAEVVRNAIKVDFWDIREMANKICAILSYPFLAAEEVRNCREELKAIRWENVADRLNAIYAQLVSGGK